MADNFSEEGRSRNRRVTLLIESMLAEEEPPPPVPLRPNDPIRSILPQGAIAAPARN